MNSLQLREDSRRGRRQRDMLWAASDVFAAFGHDLANMQMIAESAGVTKATFYAHFGDKAQLFRAVIEYWMEELPEPSLPSEVNGELRSCLEAVAQALLQQSMNPAFLALTNILLRSNWVPQKRWRQRYRPYQAYLEKALCQCARCDDPVRAAGQFLLLAVGSLDPGTATLTDAPRITAAVELFILAYA